VAHDARSGKQLFQIGARESILSHDGKQLHVYNDYDESTQLDIHDSESGKLHSTITFGQLILRPKLSFDNRLLGTRTVDGALQLWEVEKMRAIRTPPIRVSGLISAIAFSPDGTRLVSASYPGALRILDTQSSTILSEVSYNVSMDGTEMGPDDGSEIVERIYFALNGLRFATFSRCSGGDRYPIKVWRTADGEMQKCLAAEGSQAYCGALSPDGQHLAYRFSAWQWEVANIDTSSRVVGGDRDHILGGMVYSSCGQLLATTSRTDAIIWNTQTYKRLRKIKANVGNILAFSPDSRLLAAVLPIDPKYPGASSVCLYNWASATCVGRFKLPERTFRLVFRPDGLRFETNRGVLDAEHSVTTRKDSTATALSHLFLGDRWIKYGNTIVLLFPPDYGGGMKCDVHGSTMALAISGGRLILIDFDIAKLEEAGFRLTLESHNLPTPPSSFPLKTVLNHFNCCLN
jgi:WD40 repeat protein